MALGHNTSIVRDGLVFYYDMGNTQKSWRGKPVTNYYGDISTSDSLRPNVTTHFWDGYSWVINSLYTHPGVSGPQGVFLGLVYKHTSGALTSTWDGNSFGYTLKVLSNTSGNTYTISSWTYLSPDCNLDQMYCNVEGATSTSATSGYSSTYNLSQKGTWQRLGASAVSDGSIVCIPIYPGKYGVTNGTFTGFYMWAAGQVEDGSIVSTYAGSNTNYARSNTQAITDLSNNRTITANSLTYNSDGTFSFNGTSNYVTLPVPMSGLSDYSFSIWCKMGSLIGGEQRLISLSGAGTFTLRVSSSDFNFHYNPFDGSPPSTQTSSTGLTYSTSLYYNVTATNSSTNGARIYINGELRGTSERAVNFPSGNIVVGCDHTQTAFSNAIIPVFNVYNKELTATEVKQNFEALRDRYGI